MRIFTRILKKEQNASNETRRYHRVLTRSGIVAGAQGFCTRHVADSIIFAISNELRQGMRDVEGPPEGKERAIIDWSKTEEAGDSHDLIRWFVKCVFQSGGCCAARLVLLGRIDNGCNRSQINTYLKI